MDLKCCFCGMEIDLNKKFTPRQIKQNEDAKKLVESMGLNLPNVKNYYCDCGGHITLMKGNGGWLPVSSSKNG